MNERIEKLMLEATKDMPQGYYVPPNFFEKFAEMIVRECANAADMAHDARCKFPGDYVAEYMGYGQEQGITVWREK